MLTLDWFVHLLEYIWEQIEWDVHWYDVYGPTRWQNKTSCTCWHFFLPWWGNKCIEKFITFYGRCQNSRLSFCAGFKNTHCALLLLRHWFLRHTRRFFCFDIYISGQFRFYACHLFAVLLFAGAPSASKCIREVRKIFITSSISQFLGPTSYKHVNCSWPQRDMLLLCHKLYELNSLLDKNCLLPKSIFIIFGERLNSVGTDVFSIIL